MSVAVFGVRLCRNEAQCFAWQLALMVVLEQYSVMKQNFVSGRNSRNALCQWFLRFGYLNGRLYGLVAVLFLSLKLYGDIKLYGDS